MIIKWDATLEDQRALLAMAVGLDLEMYQVEGALNDEWLIIDRDNDIHIDGTSSDYILLTHEYRNSQSNDLYIIQSDGELVEGFMERYEEYMEWLEDEEESVDN